MCGLIGMFRQFCHVSSVFMYLESSGEQANADEIECYSPEKGRRFRSAPRALSLTRCSTVWLANSRTASNFILIHASFLVINADPSLHDDRELTFACNPPRFSRRPSLSHRTRPV